MATEILSTTTAAVTKVGQSVVFPYPTGFSRASFSNDKPVLKVGGVAFTDTYSVSFDSDGFVMKPGAGAEVPAGVLTLESTEVPAAIVTTRVIASSAVAIPMTGPTTETTMLTIPIPANIMGTDGMLRVTSHWSYTNSANSKTLRIRFGGSLVLSAAVTTTAQARDSRLIQNRGVTNSQLFFTNSAASGFGTSAGGIGASAIDTTAEQNLIFAGLLASGAETITLESYLVEVIS